MAAPMSDISGYRSDGGGLGQDQGISKQLRGILTAKLPLLSAPGTVLENSLYYDINSSSVTAVEEQATFNKDRISFNNLQMGATPSAYIPSVLFANSIFWVVQLQDGGFKSVDPATKSADNHINIPLGWGFHAIEDIIVYMGASSIAQIQISGRTNMHIALATCETYEKRQLMLEGAGKYLNYFDVTSIMGYPNINDKLFTMRNYGNFYNPTDPKNDDSWAPWLAQAVVPLRVPWSSMAILDKRLSLDTKLSTQPIQIALHTRRRDDFLDLGKNVTTDVLPDSFAQSTLQMWQEELSDKSLSVRNELLAMPEFNVGYPFQYAQSIPFAVSTTNQMDTGDLTTTFTMNITSIINSDLTTFLFDVTWSPRSTVTAYSGQYCPTYGEQLINIELLLNGQRFFAFDQDDYPYVTLAKQLDSTLYTTNMPAYNQIINASLVSSFSPRGYLYEFNNSRLRSIIAESHLQNTARFTNQTFQLRFQINRSQWYLGQYNPLDKTNTRNYSQNISVTQGYQLNMTYLYNAVYLVGGDGGTTKLITN